RRCTKTSLNVWRKNAATTNTKPGRTEWWKKSSVKTVMKPRKADSFAAPSLSGCFHSKEDIHGSQRHLDHRRFTVAGIRLLRPLVRHGPTQRRRPADGERPSWPLSGRSQ